jgi:hypothetical protein
MAIKIKNAEVDYLIDQLRELTGLGPTEIVKAALEREYRAQRRQRRQTQLTEPVSLLQSTAKAKATLFNPDALYDNEATIAALNHSECRVSDPFQLFPGRPETLPPASSGSKIVLSSSCVDRTVPSNSGIGFRTATFGKSRQWETSNHIRKGSFDLAKIPNTAAK